MRGGRNTRGTGGSLYLPLQTMGEFRFKITIEVRCRSNHHLGDGIPALCARFPLPSFLIAIALATQPYTPSLKTKR